MPALKTTSNGEVLTVCFLESRILDPLLIQTIQDELMAVLGKTEERFILLDFSAVKFLSSAALGMLVRVHKKCKEYKANLVLCSLDPNIREVFKITALDKALEICEDADAAQASIAKKGRFFR